MDILSCVSSSVLFVIVNVLCICHNKKPSYSIIIFQLLYFFKKDFFLCCKNNSCLNFNCIIFAIALKYDIWFQCLIKLNLVSKLLQIILQCPDQKSMTIAFFHVLVHLENKIICSFFIDVNIS